jgi:hypothetical protein
MPLLRALAEACVAMLAAVATLLCVWAVDPQVGSAVLAVVLCLALARSHPGRDLRARIEAAVALPVVGLLAAGVGMLLQRAPWLGAAVFVGAMSASIWLRRFGDVARRLGSLIALPLVALLVTPQAAVGAGPVAAIVTPLLIGLLALFWVGVFQLLARRAGLASPARAAPRPTAPARARPGGEDGLHPVASTRMAIQMAVALALSFATGYVFFAERWAWIVLTAFIVMSGNRGRLDVAYKSVLRVGGAAAGTLLAMGLSARVGAHDAATVALILCAVFIGVWLRPVGYAWWALCVTVALALLQGFTGAPMPVILWARLAEIGIGAVIGVATAWCLLPVRSSDVLRRRIADALAALSDALDADAGAGADGAVDGKSRAHAADAFSAALEAVEQMAPAFRAARALTGRWRAQQPADWIDALRACGAPALALVGAGTAPGPVRRAVGAARKAVREPAQISEALRSLHRALSGIV